MKNYVYLDIETVPTQLPDVIDELKADLIAERDAKLAEIKPPANWKDEDKIAEWEATIGAERRAAIEAEYAEKIDAKYRATSLDGAYGQIVAIGAAINNGEIYVFWDKDWAHGEAGLINRFYTWLAKSVSVGLRYDICFVGHCIVDFDLRFLFQRSVIHGIRPPSFIPFDQPLSAGAVSVFDTMTKWAGRNGRVKLDKLCRVLGIDAKGTEIGEEINGSMVWDYVQRGEIEKVAAYCAGDVERARKVHRRLAFLE